MAVTPLGVRPRAPPVQRCRWHIWFDPITAVSCRAPNTPLPCPSILFAPARKPSAVGGGAGVAAGSGTLISSTGLAPKPVAGHRKDRVRAALDQAEDRPLSVTHQLSAF